MQKVERWVEKMATLMEQKKAGRMDTTKESWWVVLSAMKKAEWKVWRKASYSAVKLAASWVG